MTDILDYPIRISGLRQLGFIRRPDLIKKLVEDCWSHRNLIIYRHQNSTEWHVQVGFFIYPAIADRTVVQKYRDLKRIYHEANRRKLNMSAL